MPGYMDPNTGLWISTDAQPDPNAGGSTGQQQDAAALAPPPIPPPAPPTTPDAPPAAGAPAPAANVDVGQPTLISPAAAGAPSTTIPDPAPGTPGAAPITPPVTTGATDGAAAPKPGDAAIPTIPPGGGPDGLLAPDLGVSASKDVPLDKAGEAKPVVPAETQDALTKQEIEERQKQAEADAANAKVKADFAGKAAKQLADYNQQRLDIIKKGEDAYAAANARTEAKYAEARARGEKDVWGDTPTMNKVLAGIALILGGRNAAYAIVGAVNGLDEKKKEEVAALQKQAERAGKSADEIRAITQDRLQDWNAQKAAGLDSTIARLDAELAQQGIPSAQRAANKDILELQAKSLEIKRQAAAQAHKDAEQGIKDDLAKHKSESDIALANARIAELQQRHKPKSGGGGGGSSALTDFVTAAGQLQPGDPIPPEVAVLGRQAGLKPNQIAGEVDKYRGSGAKATSAEAKATGAEKKADAGDDKDVNKRMDVYEKQAVGNAKSPGPVRVLSQIEAMRHGLEEAAASGDSDQIKAAVTKAKEQAGTLMSGGKLTNAQITILHGLESTGDELTAKIGKFTGNPTEGSGLIKRLTMIIDDAGRESVEQIKDLRQRAINEHLGPNGLANTPEAKRTFLNRNAGIYSEAKWRGKPLFQEGSGTAAHPVDKLAAAKRVWNDSKAPPAARAAAKQFLDANQ